MTETCKKLLYSSCKAVLFTQTAELGDSVRFVLKGFQPAAY